MTEREVVLDRQSGCPFCSMDDDEVQEFWQLGFEYNDGKRIDYVGLRRELKKQFDVDGTVTQLKTHSMQHCYTTEVSQ